jgi:hypothetical protein
MKSLLPLVLCCSGVLTGCSLLGLYRLEKPQWAPPEEAAAVQFPNSMEGGVRLTGPMMRALKVAMNDYLPPGTRPEDQKTPEARCLARWDTINTTVQQASDDLFFVRFSPDLSRCAPGFIVLDAGAVYAIDGQGRILARE